MTPHFEGNPKRMVAGQWDTVHSTSSIPPPVLPKHQDIHGAHPPLRRHPQEDLEDTCPPRCLLSLHVTPP